MDTLKYLVQVNCKNVKRGTIKTTEADDFERQMIQKYANNGKNLVTVLLR